MAARSSARLENGVPTSSKILIAWMNGARRWASPRALPSMSPISKRPIRPARDKRKRPPRREAFEPVGLGPLDRVFRQALVQIVADALLDAGQVLGPEVAGLVDRKSTRLNSR